MSNPIPAPTPAPDPKSTFVQDVEALLVRFENPQTAIATLSTLVAAFGTVGILNAPLTGWLQGVLSAVLALVTALAAKPATAALVRRAARKAR